MGICGLLRHGRNDDGSCPGSGGLSYGGLVLVAIGETRLPRIVGTACVAESFAARLLGLLGGGQDEAFAIVFPRCSDVHTFGMRRCIDVAFVDGWGGVLKAERSVPPWRRVRVRGAACVIERFAACEPWVNVGEVVLMLPRRLATEVVGGGLGKGHAEEMGSALANCGAVEREDEDEDMPGM